MTALEAELIEQEYRRMKARVAILEKENGITPTEYITEFTDGRNNNTGFHVLMTRKVIPSN